MKGKQDLVSRSRLCMSKKRRIEEPKTFQIDCDGAFVFKSSERAERAAKDLVQCIGKSRSILARLRKELGKDKRFQPKEDVEKVSQPLHEADTLLQEVERLLHRDLRHQLKKLKPTCN